VDILEFNTFKEEYDRIVSTIKTFVKAGKKYSGYAVLFRTNAITGPLVRRLMENNIPFVLKDGIPNIFDHWIYKDVEAYMVLALGDRSRKNFIRIMNKPLRYIGRDYVTDREISFGELEKYYEGKPWMIERIDKLEKDLHLMSDMTPFGMINYIRKGIGYDDYLKTYADEHDLDGKELVEIIEEIMEASKGCRSYEKLKEYIEEYSKNLKESHMPGRNKGDSVTLTTMHSAKGLEYDTVFIIDANEEITPHKKAITAEEIEEERRMFYVAMTRAKKAVSFSFTQTRLRNGKHESNSPSRFIYEVDPQYISNPISKERESGEVKRQSFGIWKKDAPAKPGYQYGQSSRAEVVRRPQQTGQQPARPSAPTPVRRPQTIEKRVPDVDFEPTPILQLKAGQRIEHNRFGFGKILEISGSAADLKAKIAFDQHGEKILILKYAKIRVVNVCQ
jgi:hypothetical protein